MEIEADQTHERSQHCQEYDVLYSLGGDRQVDQHHIGLVKHIRRRRCMWQNVSTPIMTKQEMLERSRTHISTDSGYRDKP